MANPNSSIPATSFPSHKLSSGLYVSGRPDQYKEKSPTMSSAAMPYTGGDIKKSGELGKMFDIQVEAAKSKKSGQLPTSASRSGTLGGIGSNSGPLSSAGAPRSAPSASGHMSSTGTQRQSNTSGPQLSNSRSLSGSGSAARHGSKSGPPESIGSGAVSKASVTTLPAYTPNPSKHSGPLAANLPATGLITSGPISSGPLSTSTSRKYSGPIDSAGAGKLASGPTGNNQAINNLSHDKEYSFRKNFPKRAVIGFANGYRDAELGTAKDGQYVKVTGVVTCGSVSLESSFQNVNRCIYTSTTLYEYRGFNSLQANDKHRRFTWGLRHLEFTLEPYTPDDVNRFRQELIRTYAQNGVSIASKIEGPQKQVAPTLTAFQVAQDADLILYDQKGIKVLPNTECNFLY
ncbi:hypothetical protein O6H91_Y440400 [Diphasiastrum complanatum]|nr:hypothetical protein O6H91_Y440400 [Diphasiastrum complanatum]